MECKPGLIGACELSGNERANGCRIRTCAQSICRLGNASVCSALAADHSVDGVKEGQRSNIFCRFSRHAAANGMERAEGIEPSPSAWKADILPLNHARTCTSLYEK